jgi:predicted RNA-binding Zn-ribbon protein involved in translation (DUF1610 family)
VNDKETIEQLRVQLAGCLTAAEGHAYCDRDAYGWCAAGQAVVDLRAERDATALKCPECGTLVVKCDEAGVIALERLSKEGQP